MGLLKTIGLFIITGTILVALIPPAVICLIIRPLGLKRFTSWILYKFAQFWARTLIALTGCPMAVKGREHIPKKGGVCFVSNHVGMFDIMLCLGYIGRPFGFIAKKELLLLPGINIWILLLGGLFIDRKKPQSAIKTIKEGIKRLKAGESMLVFPEGTRSRGQGLAPFRPGALKLASQSDAVIIPMAITGSYDVLEKTGLVQKVPVSVTFLPPVESALLPQEERKNRLAEILHEQIARALETASDSIVKSTHG